MTQVEPGLCGSCARGRRIRSGRGSTFWLCGRSATDPRYPRYPALPVRACAGFELLPLTRERMDTRPPGPVTED